MVVAFDLSNENFMLKYLDLVFIAYTASGGGYLWPIAIYTAIQRKFVV